VELLAQIRAADVVHLANPTLLPLAVAWLLRKPTVVEHHRDHAVCPNGLLLHKPGNDVCPGYFMAGDYRECVACCKPTMGRFHASTNLLLTFVRRWLCERVSANIAITDHVATRISLPLSRTIYHGVSDRGFEPGDEKSAPGTGLQIGYVGRFVEEKASPFFSMLEES
jgi:glycosyltransferase involved in cell wall biosynthesis